MGLLELAETQRIAGGKGLAKRLIQIFIVMLFPVGTGLIAFQRSGGVSRLASNAPDRI
ncbi:hypothetical protein [Mesorhizobium sp.]|uniref:hypothetical protein n=1 Tax=Mesorhizobium sp. TaxID=1871066 RepID=UPI0025BFBE16|nr:hypothetical protein [Mesorhizobium sp.]